MMPIETSHTQKSRQQGATLIVCMIILVIITLLGVGSMQDTTLEEKMAGNMKNRNTAFQAAESALRDAEDYLDNIVTAGDFDGSNGLLGAADDEPNYFQLNWTASNSVESISLDSTKEAPRYIIKYVVEGESDERDPSVRNYGEQGAGETVTYFKITARGTGGNDNAVVLLQTFYGKRF